ncbi:MAG: SET domain-containing protein [Ignavibacteria bacterium]
MKYKNEGEMTNQIIFELRPSSIHGVGVFSTGKIKKGTKLPLFEEEDHTFLHESNVIHTNIPSRVLAKYSIHFPEDKGYSTPKNFNRMSVGWFLNHSDKPNAVNDENYDYYALKDIPKGKEITIDYNKL